MMNSVNLHQRIYRMIFCRILLKRSPNNYGEFEGRVNAIIEEVRKNA